MCSSVAEWIRLPDLPIEFYDPTILKKIGSTIGPMLRIDSHTINRERGRFTKLCIQINIDKPLIKCVKVGKMTQAVQYEGINSLWFACGRIDHRNEGYLALISNQIHHRIALKVTSNHATRAQAVPCPKKESSVTLRSLGKRSMVIRWL